MTVQFCPYLCGGRIVCSVWNIFEADDSGISVSEVDDSSLSVFVGSWLVVPGLVVAGDSIRCDYFAQS